jgi:hypothetical protein
MHRLTEPGRTTSESLAREHIQGTDKPKHKTVRALSHKIATKMRIFITVTHATASAGLSADQAGAVPGGRMAAVAAPARLPRLGWAPGPDSDGPGL